MQKTWTWSVTSGPLLNKSHAEKQQICQQAGLSGIEPMSDFFAAVPHGQLQGLVAEYRDAGVTFDSYHLSLRAEDDIACFYETTRLQAVDTLKREMEQAAQVGARVVIQHPSTNRFSIETEGGVDPYLRQIGKSLEALLPHAAELGLIIALENMLPGEQGPRLGARADAGRASRGLLLVREEHNQLTQELEDTETQEQGRIWEREKTQVEHHGGCCS